LKLRQFGFDRRKNWRMSEAAHNRMDVAGNSLSQKDDER
jgi:hypothetical protein